MYKVYFDDELVYLAGDKELVLLHPVVELEVNKSGSFTFDIPVTNPFHNNIQELVTIVRVNKGGEDIFIGRCIDIVVDFYGTKRVTCEGELAYLLDSIQPPGEYHNATVRGFLTTLLNNHNAQVELGSGANLAITFHKYCAGESASYDHLYLYYYDTAGNCQVVLNKVQANTLAGKTYVVPASDFYIYWRTDSSVNQYYGFSIDSVKRTNEACTPAVTMTVVLQNGTEKIETTDFSNIQTDHTPYRNNQVTEWHFTFVGVDKTFQVGSVTVQDSNDSLYRYTNWENTLEDIKDKLVGRLGGYLRIRHSSGVRYLDYIAAYTHITEQVIEFGENLLDYSQSMDATDIATAVIPLGAKQEESDIAALESYLTIGSVNEGRNYVYLPSAVSMYGWIFKIVKFEDVHVPVNLKAKGEEYLTTVQYANMVLELTAVDLSLLDQDIEQILLGDTVRCRSPMHGVDLSIMVSRRTYHLDAPEEDAVTLGTETSKSMSERNVSSNQELIDRLTAMPTKQSILEEARQNVQQILNSATHGYVVTTADEQLIMDTNDVNTAVRLWRWNINGLAYSEHGYAGPYKLAITMDGTIMGDRIAAGTVAADKLSIGYRQSVETLITDTATAAEQDANQYTDTILKNSYWTKAEVQSSITNTANEIMLSVTKIEEANLHDYVVNGDFAEGEDGLTSWYKTTTATIAVVDDAILGRCVSIPKVTSSSYIRQQLIGLQAGEYTVRYKAVTTAAYASAARVQCTFNNSTQTTASGAIKAGEWTTFERKVTVAAGGSIYLYFYCYTNNTTVYLKDIEVLGDFVRYAESKLLVNDEAISAEVTRATNAEEFLASSIQVNADSIVQTVRESLAFNAHNYVLDGNFASGITENWYIYDTTGTTVLATTYLNKTCVAITTGTACYIRQAFSAVKVGKYRVLLKVATEPDFVSTARVRVSFNNTNYYSTAGEIKDSYVLLEYTFDVTATGTKYLYVYNYRAGAPIYVTDIQLLSAYEIYSQAQLTVLSDQITAEVTRATNKENSLSSSISVNASNITLKVSKGDVSSQISAESGSVSIKSSRLIVASTNFSVSGTGTVTCSGSFTTESGSYKSLLSSGYINFYYGSTLTGKLSAKTKAIGTGSTSGNVVDLETNQKATILSIGSTYYYALNNGLNPNGQTQRHWFGGTQYFDGNTYANQIRWAYNTSHYIGHGTFNGQGGSYSYSSLYAAGMLGCGGTKYRVVDTLHYGKIGMNAMESTGAHFTDIGSAVLGEDSCAYVFLDPVFLEVIDTDYEYQVFTTATSERTVAWVEKHPDHFIAHGEAGGTFDWQIIARQRDYQNDYMEPVDIQHDNDIEYDESIFYGEEEAAWLSEACMEEFEEDFDELAFRYLESYESEVNIYD